MKYNMIDGTDMNLSALCLGSMTFGSPVLEKDAIELIGYAYDKGINFIDTANMYEGYQRVANSPGGVAEQIIGKAIAGRRNRFVIATKLGMRVGNEPEDEFTSPAAIKKQLDRSLRLMNTDYIDIYYLHKYDPNTKPESILSALEDQRKLGKLRCYAVSNYSAVELKALIDAAKTNGFPLPTLCQPQLSLLNQTALTDILPLCVDNGISVVPYKILHGGVLTGKYKRGQSAPQDSRYHEKPEWMKPFDDETYSLLEQYEEAAAALNLSMTQYAIHWALEQHGVISGVIGVKGRTQLDAACAILA